MHCLSFLQCSYIFLFVPSQSFMLKNHLHFKFISKRRALMSQQEILDVCLCIQGNKVTNQFSLRSTHVNIYKCILWGFSISPGRIPSVFFLMTTQLVARIVGDHERGEGDGGEISLLRIWAFSSSPVFCTAFCFSSANILWKM